MKKIISLILVIMAFRFLLNEKPVAIVPVISILVVLFLIRLLFRSGFGKTKNGKTGSMFDDYL